MKTTGQQIIELKNHISMGLCGAPGSRYTMEAEASLASLRALLSKEPNLSPAFKKALGC